MKKTWITAGLALTLTLALTACGGKQAAFPQDGAGSAGTDAPAESTGATPNEAPQPNEPYFLTKEQATDGGWVKIYTYDENLQLVNATAYHATEGVLGDVMRSYVYEYETLENGNVQRTCKEASKIEEYDPEGRLVAMSVIGGQTHTYYAYDENDVLIKEVAKQNDQVIGYILYSYDEKGNLVKKETFSPEDIPSDYYEYEYDDAGRVTHELIHRMSNGEERTVDDCGVYTWEDTKDVYGRVVEEQSIWEPTGGTGEHYSYTYDDHGGVSSKTDYNQKGISYYLPESEVLAAQ